MVMKYLQNLLKVIESLRIINDIKILKKRAGKYDVKLLNDGWTAVTKDKSLSAQFEHTLGITENGYEIFTESAKGYSKPPYL